MLFRGTLVRQVPNSMCCMLSDPIPPEMLCMYEASYLASDECCFRVLLITSRPMAKAAVLCILRTLEWFRLKRRNGSLVYPVFFICLWLFFLSSCMHCISVLFCFSSVATSSPNMVEIGCHTLYVAYVLPSKACSLAV